jgi:carbonic anhydrase
VKKVFHFDSQTDHYRADACVVSCFDARFELVTRKFLKRRAIWWTDPLKIAGGAKIFASPADESERSFALSQVQTSMRLHRTTRIVLMVHSDCGAYGGLCRPSAATKRARPRTMKPNCAPPSNF